MNKISKIIALTLISVSPVLAAENAKEPQVKVSGEEKIGQWSFRCEEISGKSETKGCGATQMAFVENKDTKKKVPIFGIDVMIEAKSKQPVIRLSTPLGSIISEGVSMVTDGKVVEKIPYIVCNPSPLGCYAVSASKDKIDSALRNSKQVHFSFILGRGPIDVSVETEGYTKILEKLKS